MEDDHGELEMDPTDSSSLLPPPPPPVPGKSSTQEEKDDHEKDRELEELLSTAGYGLFHVLVLLVSALSIGADAVEVLGVAFIVPIAEEDLNLTTARKGYLDASIFIGMLIGSHLWGSLADVFGRKRVLLFAMFLNGVCGLVAAFSPKFLLFFLFRIFSGIAVGGSLPVSYTYVVEFYPEKRRGKLLISISCFFTCGIIYAAFLAWALLGTESSYSAINFYIGSLRFSNWRLFLIICTFPAFLFTFLMLFMPESPAYLFQAGKREMLNKVLLRIHRINSACSCCWAQRPIANPKLTSNYHTSEKTTATEPPSSLTSLRGLSRLARISYICIRMAHHLDSKVTQIIRGNVLLFRRKYLRTTILLIVIHFSIYFGFYTLNMWFPEYFKRLLASRDCNETMAVIDDCNNLTTHLQFYQDTLYVAIASIVGGIAGILLIGLTGGKILLAVSSTLAALSVFFIWGVPASHTAVVGMSALFGASGTPIFGCTNVVVANVYDPGVRATSFGVFLGMGRIGAILGNITFGYLIDVDRAIPILIVASVLTVGAVAAIFLPQIYRPENRPPLERAINSCICYSQKIK